MYFYPVKRSFLARNLRVSAAMFKGNIRSSEKLGIKELISNPDITILIQDK